MKRSWFLSSFTRFILELNEITPAEEDLTKAPKPIDSTVIQMMRYFQNEDGAYYYLDDVDRHVYEDIIEVPRAVTTKRKKSLSTLN